MNITSPIKFPRRPAAGFTLVEVIIASAIFIVIIGALVSVQIFGLRVYTLASTKLTATTSGRETLNDLRDQIRESQQVYVGTFSNSTFNQIPNGQQQIGNALQVFTTTNSASTNFLVYYQDPSLNTVFVYANNPANKSVEATYMTNSYWWLIGMVGHLNTHPCQFINLFAHGLYVFSQLTVF